MTDPTTSSTDTAPPTRKGSAITLTGVTKAYGEDRVVDGVHIDIRPGEFCSLLGPSGSGKTTTLMMIAGFAQIDAGRIELDGKDIAGTPPNKRGFGLVFQNYAIFPHLNVFENVAFPLRARGWPRTNIADRVARALRLVRLERFATSFSRQLSGGQQQRVAIARAVAKNPAVLLCDEPTGALDVHTGILVLEAIAKINHDLGTTTAVITHNAVIAEMADRVISISDGKIVHVQRNATKRAASELTW